MEGSIRFLPRKSFQLYQLRNEIKIQLKEYKYSSEDSGLEKGQLETPQTHRIVFWSR